MLKEQESQKRGLQWRFRLFLGVKTCYPHLQPNRFLKFINTEINAWQTYLFITKLYFYNRYVKYCNKREKHQFTYVRSNIWS